MDPEKAGRILSALQELPRKAQEILSRKAVYLDIAESIKHCSNLFFIGRGYDYNIAQEGALKLKEISYIHAEAYAAGELKHGTLALITEESPVIAIAVQKKTYEKTMSNIKEVNARDAYIIGLAREGCEDIKKYVNRVLYIPDIEHREPPF